MKVKEQGGPEIDEDALRGFGAQVADLVPAGPDGGAEHQVEGEGLGDVVVGVRSLHPVLGQLLPQLLRAELVQPAQNVPHLLRDKIILGVYDELSGFNIGF